MGVRVAHGGRVLSAAVLLLVAAPAYGHVSLLYPPARQYALDFLDNFRTVSPCGMPKGLGPKTTWYSNQSYEITWHLGYPHQGGFHLDLLDATYRRVYMFTELRWVVGDTTRQTFQVQIPSNLTCSNCTIQLTRQALEWGRSYTFLSCADVDILSGTEFVASNCPEHSEYDPRRGECRCEYLYSGDHCQYKDVCMNDSDCLNNGICRDVQLRPFVRHACYCRAGFMGDVCQTESPVAKRDLDFSGYKRTDLTSSLSMYHKLLPNTGEIEVVVTAPTVSWLGIGFRAEGTDRSCQLFPVRRGSIIYNGPPVAEPTGEPEHEPTGEPHHEPEPTGEPHYEPEPTGEPHYEPEPTGEPHYEPEPTVEPHYEPEPTGEPHHEPEPTGEPHHEPEPTGEPHYEPEPHNDTISEPEPTGEGEPEAEPTSEPEVEPSSEPEGETNLPTPHPMDCTDMVIGSAYGSWGRVADYYTRDRSTPQPDSFYGYSDSLTGATAFESGGSTFIIFRRKLIATEPTDVSITTAPLHVIWAMGQPQASYIHFPPSGLEGGPASVKDFYRDDELKYHGHRSQRGHTTVNFLEEEDSPGSQWTGSRLIPRLGPVEFTVRWRYRAADDSMVFTVSLNAAVQPDQTWFALGFSDDTFMAGSDVLLVGESTSGGWEVTDRWADGYFFPRSDNSQDVRYDIASDSSATIAMIERLRQTSDSSDYQFTASNCPYLMFAVGGYSATGRPTQHFERPIVSRQRVCVYSPDGGEVTDVTVFPPSVREVVPGTFIPDVACSAKCAGTCSYSWTRDYDGEEISTSHVLSLGFADRVEIDTYTCTVTSLGGKSASKKFYVYPKRVVSGAQRMLSGGHYTVSLVFTVAALWFARG